MKWRNYVFRSLAAWLVFIAIAQAQQLNQAPQMPKVEPFGIDGFRLMLQQEGLELSLIHI